MLCRKEKTLRGNWDSEQLFRHPLGDFRHPLKISLPPHGRNPEIAPDLKRYTGLVIESCMQGNIGVVLLKG